MTTTQHSPRLDPPAITFLARHRLAKVGLHALQSDASARRYTRLEAADQLLMEDRNDPVGFAAFVRLARHLASLGLSSPRVYGADPSTGIALIEDFGTCTYSAQLAAGRDETALYTLAVDALLHLHHHPEARQVTVPTYDLAMFLDELSTFSHWFASALRPELDVATFDEQFRALWRKALEPIEHGHKTLVLRDFHVDNLMVLEAREGVLCCGLLDFQDGVIGPAEYDLVSLLQDARRDLSDGLEAEMLARYIASAPNSSGSAADITHRYHLLGAQRHTRIAGQFLRLYQRDEKSGYLAFMPRVMRQMQTAVKAANLHDIAAFLDTTLPEWRNAGDTFSRLF